MGEKHIVQVYSTKPGKEVLGHEVCWCARGDWHAIPVSPKDYKKGTHGVSEKDSKR